MKKQARQQQHKRLRRYQKEDVEIRKTHRGEKKHTQRRETAPERSEPTYKRVYQRQKRMKRQQDIQSVLEDFKVVKNIPGIKSAKKRVLITKIKKKKGEIITSRKRDGQCLWRILQKKNCVCGVFYKTICTTTMNKKNLNNKSEGLKMRAASMCITTTPMR